MTETISGPAVLIPALADAVYRAPKEPARTVLWPASMWARISIALSLFVLGIGFTAGSIAINAIVYDVPATLAWLLGITQALPLIVAARWPLVSWRIMACGMLAGTFVLGRAELFIPWPIPALIGIVLALIGVGASYQRGVSVGTGLLTVLAMVVSGIQFGGVIPWFGFILTGLIVAALVFGDAIGGRYAAEQQVASISRLREDELARAAVLQERSRIARELHDVVAHHMSVIALQAEAAPYKIPDLPAAAHDTFSLLRDEARSALAETRRVVGLLRQEDDTAERVPQPGLDGLDRLVGAHEGLNVDLAVTGMPRPLDEGLDLSAYRIVQEALSNAARHAPGSTVRVEIHYGSRVLRISIRDDGCEEGGGTDGGGGHGLVGMRERVAMLGGTLVHGPDGDGWAVVAELPYDGGHDPRGDR